MAWLDTHASTAAARSWAAWSRRLEIDGRVIERQVDALALHGWSGAGTALDRAGDDLQTLAVFVRDVRDAVERADRLPTTRAAVAQRWVDAERSVDRSTDVRHATAADLAVDRYASTRTAADVRHRFESEHGDDPAVVLHALTGTEAVDYWEAMPRSVQLELADHRPDLVALRVLAAGGTVAAVVAATLDRANAYERFTETFAVGLGASVNARVLTVEIGGGFTAITTKLSDGSVMLTLVEGIEIGVGAGLEVPGTASAHGFAGAVGHLHQRFRFDDETAAGRAIDTLRDAAHADLAFGELLRDGAGLLWNHGVDDWNTAATVANWVIPFGDPVPTLPTYDLTPDTVHRLRELWRSNGLTHGRAAGLATSINAELDGSVGTIGAEIAASGDAELVAYDTDVAATDATGTLGQTGVLLSGTASIEMLGGVPTFGAAFGHGRAAAGFVLDLYRVDGGDEFATLTVHADVARGAASALIDLEAIAAIATVDDTAAMTVEFTVPVDDDSRDSVRDLAVELARGSWPTSAIRDLTERAELDVVVATGTESSTDVAMDGAVVDVGLTVATTATATQLALHRYPGGELFSRVAVDRLIDRALSAGRVSRAGRR